MNRTVEYYENRIARILARGKESGRIIKKLQRRIKLLKKSIDE